MNIEAQTILSDLKAKREIRGPVLHFRDYWRTYGAMALYAAVLVVLDLEFKPRVYPHLEVLMLYAFLAVIVMSAIKDGQKAINRRFDRLVELLEKKGVL